MANEKDASPPAQPAPSPPVEGPTKQFSLKMSSWLMDLAGDLEAPAGAPPAIEDAPLDELIAPVAVPPSPSEPKKPAPR